MSPAARAPSSPGEPRPPRQRPPRRPPRRRRPAPRRARRSPAPSLLMGDWRGVDPGLRARGSHRATRPGRSRNCASTAVLSPRLPRNGPEGKEQTRRRMGSVNVSSHTPWARRLGRSGRSPGSRIVLLPDLPTWATARAIAPTQWCVPVSSPVTVAGAAPALHRLPVFSPARGRATAPLVFQRTPRTRSAAGKAQVPSRVAVGPVTAAAASRCCRYSR